MAEFKFAPAASVIVVDCELMHTDTCLHVSLVFDTGATYTMVSWSIAEKLGLDPAKTKEPVPFSTASGRMAAPLVTVQGINVKGAIANQVALIVHDLPEEARVDGLLGLNFLRNFQVCLDFSRGVISLT